MKRLLILTILSLFVMASCHQNSTGTGYCTVKGTVKGLKDGTKLELQDEFHHFEIVGKGVVKNIPQLVEIYAKYHKRGLGIYGVSFDPKRRCDTWKTFLQKNKMTWINVCDFNGGGKKNSKAWYDYALSGIPTTLLIDCQTGKIIARGELDEIEAKLAELLPSLS